MNTREANSVRTVLGWLLRIKWADGRVITDEEAREAGIALADDVRKRLGNDALLTPAQVRRRWPVQGELWPALTEPPKTQLDLMGQHKRPTPPPHEAEGGATAAPGGP